MVAVDVRLGALIGERLDEHVFVGRLQAARPLEPEIARLRAGAFVKSSTTAGKDSAFSGLTSNFATMKIMALLCVWDRLWACPVGFVQPITNKPL